MIPILRRAVFFFAILLFGYYGNSIIDARKATHKKIQKVQSLISSPDGHNVSKNPDAHAKALQVLMQKVKPSL